ncbi:dihydrofolate reductase family protein [Acanthopleuribacter pedis]|uniref:Dihydrofolate reductase n=1 Tax=Acanthopleuribacter pedis TaxID=442870 RepID=A0A8J7QJ51_9BACT|nr:dihydrofolate reductase family protein [Acanthopleuribacter pedis]MBO1319148.1 dihydrofolate reductase [Acanthopleuribacter pedis]
MSPPQVRVYLACSLDGFIAGPDHDLSWLPSYADDSPAALARDTGSIDYETFIADVGAMLMGRRTYDVVRGFGGDWHYGDLPIHVATTRALDDAPPAAVKAVRGSIATLITEAKAAARGKNLYLDGGDLIRQAADADLIDHFIITYAPVALGRGTPLFGLIQNYYHLEITGSYRHDYGMLQVHARPRRPKDATPATAP